MAIDAKTGKTLWVTPSTAAFFYGGNYADGKVIFGGLDNNMYAWDAKTGSSFGHTTLAHGMGNGHQDLAQQTDWSSNITKIPTSMP